MMLINGKKITAKDETEQIHKKPSINEILEKMQNNYNNINYSHASITSHNQPQQNNTNQTEGETQSNLLLSLLPALLKNKSEASVQTQSTNQTDILKTLLKNLNNPMLEKLFELLPLFSKQTKNVETSSQKQKEEPKIDSFIKTDDYHNN